MKMSLIGTPGRSRRRLVVALGSSIISLCSNWTATALAAKEDRVYTIGSFPVEARAANAVAAKERAIADGQQAAFRSLLKRIVPSSSYGRIAHLKRTRAGDLIDGVSVRSERNSQTEYIASYDFSFQAESVRRLLDQEGIPFLDRQAPPITLVPVFSSPKGGGETIDETRGSDTWLYAWKGLDLANTLTPVSLKTLPKPLAPEVAKAIAAGDANAVRTIANELKTETLVVAVLEPDPGQRKIRVALVGRDAVASFALLRSYRDGGDLGYTAELAAVISLGVLEGRWKAINVRSAGMPVASPVARTSPRPWERPETSISPPMPPPAQPASADGVVRIAIEFGSIAEWEQISRKVVGVPGVTDMDVEGLSARSARIALRYPGGAQALGPALAQQGLNLRSAGSGWVLSAR